MYNQTKQAKNVFILATIRNHLINSAIQLFNSQLDLHTRIANLCEINMLQGVSLKQR